MGSMMNLEISKAHIDDLRREADAARLAAPHTPHPARRTRRALGELLLGWGARLAPADDPRDPCLS